MERNRIRIAVDFSSESMQEPSPPKLSGTFNIIPFNSANLCFHRNI